MRKFLLLVLMSALSVSGVALAAQAKPKPNPAKQISGTTWLSGNHSEGSKLYVGGDFKANFFGRGALVYVVTISPGQPGSLLIKSKHIVLYTNRGSLTGTGQATDTINSDLTETVTDGTFSLTKGTGAYKGHSFKGTFEGSGDGGYYEFTFKGKYK